jgi:hypothetical protein
MMKKRNLPRSSEKSNNDDELPLGKVGENK